ncbi:hypothetical protein ACFW6V_20685 [Streptomyces sp. NPDC058734]|uniref:hypothetical protein n=1 Tax=Streptomyces sp. NPDC058734 TaxID=3346615 RepID=UPI0036999E0A
MSRKGFRGTSAMSRRWARTVCAAISANPKLIRSLLVARIAVHLAQGKGSADILDLLAVGPAFSAPGPGAEELTSLITTVRSAFESDGLTNSVAADGLGLLSWSPERTYMLLIEYWAAQRGLTVSRARVEQELCELWDTEDSRLLTAHSSLPAFPLRGYPDVWEKLKAEPDFRVGNAGALTLTRGGGGDRAWERWMSTRPWSTLKARHLVSLGGDLARCQAARRALSRLLEQAPPGDDFCCDISTTLTDVATHALRRLMPRASGPALYGEEVPELEPLLAGSALPEIVRHPR